MFNKSRTTPGENYIDTTNLRNIELDNFKSCYDDSAAVDNIQKHLLRSETCEVNHKKYMTFIMIFLIFVIKPILVPQ